LLYNAFPARYRQNAPGHEQGKSGTRAERHVLGVYQPWRRRTGATVTLATGMPRRHQEAKPRSDVERNRTAILDAAVRQLAHSAVLEMRSLAADAGVSRSTLYRRFGNADDVRRAVLDRALADARNEARAALAADAPPLAL